MIEWQKIETGPTGRTLHNGAVSQRVSLWVPPYGQFTGHYDNGWQIHSLGLPEDATPSHWAELLPPPPEKEWIGATEFMRQFNETIEKIKAA